MDASSEILNTIKTDLDQARATLADAPEKLADKLADILARLCAFKEYFVNNAPRGVTEVDATAFDAIVVALFGEWTALLKQHQGISSEPYAAAVAAWYSYAPEDTSDLLVEALAGADVWTEAHWGCVHLLALVEENLRFCVAAFFKAQEEGRQDIEESCRARLLAESDDFLTETVPGLRHDDGFMTESNVLTVPTWGD